MMQCKKKLVILSVLVFLVASSSVVAQDKNAPSGSEMKSEVPELTNFHEVIYKIWHTAWPNKDVAMLRDLSSEVEQLGGNLINAQLPGILREKKIAWQENIDKMKLIIAAYREAAMDTSSQRLLNAAELLHAQYEKLVRVVRPALKELDDFHAVLYPLYHYYMPQKDLDAIKSSVAQMKEKMGVLEKAVLPSRFKEKGQVFGAARSNLAVALKALDAALSSKQPSEIDKNINHVHSRYEELNKIFD